MRTSDYPDKDTFKGNLFAEQEAEKQISQLEEYYDIVSENHINSIIEIPRIVIEQQHVKAIFEDFDLDTSEGYNLDKLRREIIRQGPTNSSNFEVIAGKVRQFQTPRR